jgi:uncharacterized protein with NRDE domain
MCTVSFIPVRDSFFITSNRDEKLTRKTALPPVAYKEGENYLVYPKDADAGGTWIVMKENGDCAVLLNGAFLPHQSIPPYRKSRGQILLDLVNDPSPSQRFEKFSLDNIQPFTLILMENGSLYEFRWDGQERYRKRLASDQSYIWSSCTLYDGLVIKKRERWFATFLNRNPHPTQRDILNFHRFTGDGDKANDLLMNRDNTFSTVSITSIHLTAERGSMKYLDALTNQLTEKNIGFIKNSQET